MAIIRDLYKNYMVIEPWNIREWSKMYLHYARNVEWGDDSINHRLLDLGVFQIY